MAKDSPSVTLLDPLINMAVTLICWAYFIFAFLFFFSFFYAAALLFAGKRQYAFQYLNHLFFKGFLGLLRFLAPRHSWSIDPDIAGSRGCIIVCNHRSYLDPLILLSLLRRNKTIVKTKFFGAPVFGLLLMVSGYLPSTTEGRHGLRMLREVENMGTFFKDGGNLFVFPEGHRNTGETLGAFHEGVFKIARMYGCPVKVLALRNTDKLFSPGKFFFKCRTYNRISIKTIGTVARAGSTKVSAAALESRVRQIFAGSGMGTGEGL